MHNKIEYPIIGYDNNFGEISNSLNFGQKLEQVVRNDRMSISELARRLNVSRRTIYNWFEAEKLSIDVISKIGFVIGHDFSNEFPEQFVNIDNYSNGNESLYKIPGESDQWPKAIYYWMNRYIKLLEKFNEVLSHEIKDDEKKSGL